MSLLVLSPSLEKTLQVDTSKLMRTSSSSNRAQGLHSPSCPGDLCVQPRKPHSTVSLETCASVQDSKALALAVLLSPKCELPGVNTRPSSPWKPPTVPAASQEGEEGGTRRGEGWRLPQAGTHPQLQKPRENPWPLLWDTEARHREGSEQTGSYKC